MASRDPQMLYEPLRKRWQHLKDEWDEPNREPFLTATYRNDHEQQLVYDAGKSDAKPGQSLHNFNPSYAFDFAFRKPDGSVDWSWQLYDKFGKKGKELGLEWGGDWQGLKDGTHLQWPTNYKEAEAGDIPDLPPLPESEKREKELSELFAELKTILQKIDNHIS